MFDHKSKNVKDVMRHRSIMSVIRHKNEPYIVRDCSNVVLREKNHVYPLKYSVNKVVYMRNSLQKSQVGQRQKLYSGLISMKRTLDITSAISTPLLYGPASLIHCKKNEPNKQNNTTNTHKSERVYLKFSCYCEFSEIINQIHNFQSVFL